MIVFGKQTLEFAVDKYSLVLLDASVIHLPNGITSLGKIQDQIIKKTLSNWKDINELITSYSEDFMRICTTKGVIGELGKLYTYLEKNKEIGRSGKKQKMQELLATLHSVESNLLTYDWRTNLEIKYYRKTSETDASLVSSLLHYLLNNHAENCAIITRDNDIGETLNLTVSSFDKGLKENLLRRGHVYLYNPLENLVERHY